MGNINQNRSNPYTTNKFETLVGALNIAPTKVSAQYKIVVALDGNLYLDDYTERRTILDINKSFLPQVAKFLSVSTVINDNSKLRYGAYQKSTKKYFHIPFYFGNDVSKYPTHYVLTKAVNETITDPEFLYRFGNILQVVDLKLLGLHKIFDEINSEPYFDYPLYFNWDEGFIKCYGYGINENLPVIHSFDLTKIRANQPYLDVFNNKILNEYNNNGIFFPRFLNIEFEFDYSNDYTHFNNFFGYLSIGSRFLDYNPETNNLLDNKLYIKSRESLTDTIWSQVSSRNLIELNPYKVIQARGSIQDVKNQQAQYRFQVNKINVNDSIKILHPDGETVEFEYIVKQSNIVGTSLFQSLIIVSREATKASGRKFIFSVTEGKYNCILTVIWNNIDKFDEDFSISYPNHFNVLDRYVLDGIDVEFFNYNKFRGLKSTDIWLRGNPNLLGDNTTISILDVDYTIVERFGFNGQYILRLDKDIQFSRVQECIIFQDKVEHIIELNPIPYLNTNSDLKSYLPYEQQLYINELIDKFVTNADGSVTIDGQVYELADIAQSAIDKFASRNEEALLQYVREENGEFVDSDIVVTKDWNTTQILNLMFCASGMTTYITPQILNIDKQFYLQNGNIDINQLNSDILKFNWFLIKGVCPSYLSNDVRALRYFTTKPQITSRLVKVSDVTCETIFLGVKYQLPIKYEDYNFAVYLNPNNESHLTLNYSFDVNHADKTLYLSINKYLDFIDLIRGGNPNELPLIDLSFFHNTVHSHNTNSQILENFKVGGLIICPDNFNDYDDGVITTPEGTPVNNWYYPKVNGEYNIGVFRDLVAGGTINNFNDFFRVGSDNTLYIYSSVIYNGSKYTFISMIVDIIGINFVATDFLWCNDIRVRFFDTPTIFLKKFNIQSKVEELFYIEETDIHDLVPASPQNIYSEYTKIATVITDGISRNFELLLPDTELSLKEEYFEIHVDVVDNGNGTKSATKSLFKFPEFKYTDYSDNEFIDIFYTDPVDTTQPEYKITLFNRNQIWRVIRDLVRVDLKFKEMLESQVRAVINDLMITNLVDTTEIGSIPIRNSDEFIKMTVVDTDRNIGIWKMLGENRVTLFNRYSTAYFPYFQLFDNEKQFQLGANGLDNHQDTLFNIYDLNFGRAGSGENPISATGIWQEVQGNIVSSLFSKSNDIELILPFEPAVNLHTIIIQFLNIEECIINNRNEEYIKKINRNVDTYIMESYAKYLLENFYVFDSVYDNTTGKRINFTMDKKNKYIVRFDSNQINTYQLKFVFKRK